MNVLELFSGTGVLASIARERGHEAFTVDLTEPADLNADLLTLTAADLLAATGWTHVDMVWASPPCTGFSVASIGRMWTKHDDGTYTPKHETSRHGERLLRHALALIEALAPRVWYLENPRGMMRRQQPLARHPRQTVTFCQYGEMRMKPTDIWHADGITWRARPHCRNGDTCHEAAPRGSSTGTQGLKGWRTRARLPAALCVEVIAAAEQTLAAPKPGPEPTAPLFQPLDLEAQA